MTTETNEKSKKNGTGKIVIGLVLLILVAACAFFAFNYYEAKKKIDYLSSIESNQGLLNEEEKAELIAKVGKLIVLSEDTEPMIATITNVENLVREQPFFKDAENGDRVLIFKDKAIIYSVSKNILINVGPVYTNDQPKNQEQPKNSEEQISVIKLDIRNGSTTSGSARNFAERLNDKKEYNVINIADASRKDYPKTLLVNLNSKEVSFLEKELGVTAVATLPEGENNSDADVIIIIGGETN